MDVLGRARHAAAPEEAAPDTDHRLAAVRGARILLVEDNDINQQVARELLEEAGVVVDVADNGEVALRKLDSGAYDLVFMDMQMPVMDGVTATQHIRAMRRFDALPIVAMTANAMEQDRRKCLAAGMNDFLVKPIDPEELWAIVRRWVRTDRAAAAEAAVPAQRAAQQPAQPQQAAADGVPRNISGLDTTLGLSRMMNKKPLYLAMLKRYASGQREAMLELRRALASADFETAERVAHTAKAVSGNVGATLVQEKAGALESALRERREGSQVEPLVAELDAAIAPLLEALDTQLA
jgi:CheY-like chemotaxis protein